MIIMIHLKNIAIETENRILDVIDCLFSCYICVYNIVAEIGFSKITLFRSVMSLLQSEVLKYFLKINQKNLFCEVLS